MGILKEFFGREAGQARRQWLNSRFAGAEDALRYYAGPTGIPDKLNAVAELLQFTDAGDVYEAQAGAEDMRNAEDVWGLLQGAGRTATGVAAAALPVVGAKMANNLTDAGIDWLGSAVDDVMAGYDPNQLNAFTAWHGSPHDFDKFDINKIGTGEGAQAYGHGLYFAERPEIAQFYRDNYAKPDASLFSTETSRQMAQDQLQAWAGDIPGGIDDLKASLKNMETTARFFGADEADTARMQDLREAIAYMEAGAPRGRLYEVSIDADPEDFLDWDAYADGQPEAVRKYFEEKVGFVPDNSGGTVLSRLEGGTSRDAVAAELRARGIPGIRYLDQGSRGAGDGTRNYVLFDDSLVSILNKYGLAGIMAGGAMGLTPSEESEIEAYLGGT